MTVARHKIVNLLKTLWDFVLFLLVFVYLMCGPRQLFFFQCGPEMPKGWRPLILVPSLRLFSVLVTTNILTKCNCDALTTTIIGAMCPLPLNKSTWNLTWSLTSVLCGALKSWRSWLFTLLFFPWGGELFLAGKYPLGLSNASFQDGKVHARWSCLPFRLVQLPLSFLFHSVAKISYVDSRAL